MKNDRMILALGAALLLLVAGAAAWALLNPPPPETSAPGPSDAARPRAPEPGPTAETAPIDSPATDRAPLTAVVWISLDGLRADYLDRGETPFLARLEAEGASSRELVPGFPSLTFPSHVTQATGVGAARHGIPSNSFYDKETGEHHRYPGDNALLEAEGIWTTAARQGLRVGVIDWTLSHNQRGPTRATYFDPSFQNDLDDAERLGRLLGLWRDDRADPPLQLLMGYASGLDKAGHSHGPDAPEVADALRQLDGELQQFFDALLADWQDRMTPDDRLYLILTTDHGMAPVHAMIDLEALAGLGGRDDVVAVTSGNIGHIYLPGDAPDPDLAGAIVARVAENGGAWSPAFARGDLPPDWEFGHPTRVGDVVVVLDPGYAFSSRPLGPGDDARARVSAPVAEVGGPLGMHGYDPATCPEMLGAALFWRHPEPLGGRDLGRIDSGRLHATAALLLGIEPAEGARTDAVPLDEPPGPLGHPARAHRAAEAAPAP